MALADPVNKSSSETNRRLSESRSCAGCTTSLQGRRPQAKFCSDRCRVRFARRSRLGALKDLRSRLDSSIAESIHIRADLDRLIGVAEMSSRSRRRSASVTPGHQCEALVGEEALTATDLFRPLHAGSTRSGAYRLQRHWNRRSAIVC